MSWITRADRPNGAGRPGAPPPILDHDDEADDHLRPGDIARAVSGGGLGLGVPRAVIVESMQARKVEALTTAIHNAEETHRRDRSTMDPQLVVWLRDFAEQHGYPAMPDPATAPLRAALRSLPDTPAPVLVGSELVPWDEIHDESGRLRPQYVPDQLTRERMNVPEYVALVRATERRTRAAAAAERAAEATPDAATEPAAERKGRPRA